MTTTRLLEQYATEVVPALQERFKYQNAMQVPRLEKIVVNAGVGEAVQEAKALDTVVAELAAITGQKPAIRRARRAISNFKLREGMPIGAMVTLRREHMFEFLDRFVNFSLPQARDFRGVPVRGFDGRGNYNLGIREQIIFPEIDYDRVDQIRGMNITFVTSAKSDEEAKELLRLLGVPFSN
ncbi:MAG: 50S ribosomal protein L5 [Verrucomicrobia bacterium]|jgi:large subunit ribosomal protein L5|nr:50S ribosomal protein L5 [Verrucomicrobiota bacterium]